MEQRHTLALEACLLPLLLKEVAFVLAHHLRPLFVNRRNEVTFDPSCGVHPHRKRLSMRVVLVNTHFVPEYHHSLASRRRHTAEL